MSDKRVPPLNPFPGQPGPAGNPQPFGRHGVIYPGPTAYPPQPTWPRPEKREGNVGGPERRG